MGAKALDRPIFEDVTPDVRSYIQSVVNEASMPHQELTVKHGRICHEGKMTKSLSIKIENDNDLYSLELYISDRNNRDESRVSFIKSIIQNGRYDQPRANSDWHYINYMHPFNVNKAAVSAVNEKADASERFEAFVDLLMLRTSAGKTAADLI